MIFSALGYQVLVDISILLTVKDGSLEERQELSKLVLLLSRKFIPAESSPSFWNLGAADSLSYVCFQPSGRWLAFLIPGVPILLRPVAFPKLPPGHMLCLRHAVLLPALLSTCIVTGDEPVEGFVLGQILVRWRSIRATTALVSGTGFDIVVWMVVSMMAESHCRGTNCLDAGRTGLVTPVTRNTRTIKASQWNWEDGNWIVKY